MWIQNYYEVTAYWTSWLVKLQLLAMDTFCLIFGQLICEWLQLQVLPTMYCKQEVRNGMVPNHAYPFVFYRGMPRNGSPPGGLMIKTVTMFLLLVKIKHLGVRYSSLFEVYWVQCDGCQTPIQNGCIAYCFQPLSVCLD